jgi:hypothetical protein
MSTYELDDALVRDFIVHNGSGMNWKMVEVLEQQLPTPVPTKLGAVVRTTEGVAVLARFPEEDNAPWILHANAEDWNWRHPDAIGRVTEVLFEGVDL